MAQLEGRRLETQVASRRDPQDKPEVDVDQMAVAGDHDVAVVAILGVEEVAGDGVAVCGGGGCGRGVF